MSDWDDGHGNFMPIPDGDKPLKYECEYDGPGSCSGEVVLVCNAPGHGYEGTWCGFALCADHATTGGTADHE